MKVEAYKEITVYHAHSGFGMYQIGESNGEAWESLYDLEVAIGVLFLPLAEALNDEAYIAAGVEDITGKIYGGDPDYLYARLDQSPDGLEIGYFGINKIEVDNEQYTI